MAARQTVGGAGHPGAWVLADDSWTSGYGLQASARKEAFPLAARLKPAWKSPNTIPLYFPATGSTGASPSPAPVFRTLRARSSTSLLNLAIRTALPS